MTTQGDHSPGARIPVREPRLRIAELEELYRGTPVGLCVVDRALRIERASDAFLRIAGRPLDQLVGLPLDRALGEPAGPIARSAALRAIGSARPELGVELRALGPDGPGDRRCWLTNVHPLSEDGEVLGALASFQEITSLRRDAEGYRERLAELESVYRNAPVGLSYIDRELRYLRVNQAIADMNGVEIEAMIGRRYRDLSPATAGVAEPFLKKIIEREKSVRNLEVRSTPPADPGAEHVYLLSMDPVRNDAGVAVGYTTSVQDVTELRQAQATAAHRLEEIETLYRNTPVGLCLFDPDLRIAHLNPLFAQLGEFPLEDQIGALAEEVLRADVAEQIVPQLRSVARMGAGFACEIRAKLPGAAVREQVWIANAHPVVSRAGHLNGIVMVLQDVTVLVQQQAETEANRDRLEEAQHVAHVGSWEWDMLQDRIWWSSELYTILGEESSYEPTFDSIFERVHPDDQASFREQLERTLTADEPYRMTFRLIRSDGIELMLFTAARLERTELGMPARLIGTCQDLTELEQFRPGRGPKRSRRKR